MQHIVIGSNYGDEGKGLIVDCLCALRRPHATVRFNGGGQAGHTVCRDNVRHVFSHVGAGGLRGIPTYLTDKFVFSVMHLRLELHELSSHGICPTIYVDPRAIVTLPADVIINRAVERSRGDLKHGSVGCGVYEAIFRSGTNSRILVGDLLGSDSAEAVARRLNDASYEWLQSRIRSLTSTMPDIAEACARVIATDETDCTIAPIRAIDISHVRYVCRQLQPEELNGKMLVCEGAQGLGLHHTRGHYPHVTPSDTGVTNAVDLLSHTNDTEVEVTYVTRTYVTRHGAGPLEYENDAIGQDITDHTNQPSIHQGHLRMAPISMYELSSRILADASSLPSNWNTTVNIAVTWLDYPRNIPVVDMDGTYIEVVPSSLPDLIESRIGLPVKYTSTGPSARDVVVRY